jgi:hypothetical protein
MAQKKRAVDLVKDMKFSIPETHRALHITHVTTGDDGRHRPLFKGCLRDAAEGVFAAIIVMLFIAAIVLIITNTWPSQ